MTFATYYSVRMWLNPLYMYVNYNYKLDYSFLSLLFNVIFTPDLGYIKAIGPPTQRSTEHH